MGSIVIGISEMATAKDGDSIITYALGSCIGVALYDPVRKIAGLAHIMLPTAQSSGETVINAKKFADTAIPELITLMSRAGAAAYSLTAKIAGGAQMFRMSNAGPISNIGERNVVMARRVLEESRIKIVAEDVGGNTGRTVELFSADGTYRIKSIAKGIKDI